MIENHVHHHLQSLAVGFVYEALVVFVGSEARVNTIIVGGGVSVIGRAVAVAGAVVLQYGRKPQRCNPQVGKIIEVLAYSFKVTAMTQTGSRSVAGLVTQVL